ncbi:MAG TPA: DUF1015 domain-containing protein [Methylomirabilota bacterium]|nr:DUF1015 domain-containing protein [Methylomirabilota bacterium]
MPRKLGAASTTMAGATSSDVCTMIGAVHVSESGRCLSVADYVRRPTRATSNMADVQAFRGWRYDLGQVGNLSDVIAPPYDVIGPEQQTKLYQQHPCNVIRLDLNRVEPGDTDTNARYERAANFLRHWQSEGILLQEHENALYVYHQEFDWAGCYYVRKGFMGRVRVEEFGKGKIYPHEQTLSGPKADRLALTKATKMNLSPVFGLYPDSTGAVNAALEAATRGKTPLIAQDHLGVVHKLWPVTDVAAINTARSQLQELRIFIADGHHRYETANDYRNWLIEQGQFRGEADPANFVLMMLVGMSDPGLAILPTHRLVSGLPALSAADLKAALSSHLELELMGHGAAAAQKTWERIETEGEQNVFGFGTAADGEWLFGRVTDDSPMATLAPEQTEAWRELGVSLLHKLIIDHLLAKKYPTAKREFKYVHLLEETADAIAAKSCQLACLVPPAQIEHVEEIASKFEKMPPKSTYFYPKLLTGLVFNALDKS